MAKKSRRKLVLSILLLFFGALNLVGSLLFTMAVIRLASLGFPLDPLKTVADASLRWLATVVQLWGGYELLRDRQR